MDGRVGGWCEAIIGGGLCSSGGGCLAYGTGGPGGDGLSDFMGECWSGGVFVRGKVEGVYQRVEGVGRLNRGELVP